MLKYKLITGVYYFVFTITMFFMAPFFLERGVDQVTIGYVSAFSIFMLIMAYVGTGYLADEVLGDKKILIIGTSISVFLFLIMGIVKNTKVLMLAFVLVNIFFISLAAIIDDMILNIKREKYTHIRMFGSLGAGVAYVIGAFFLQRNYFDKIFLLVVVLLVAMLLAILKVEETRVFRMKDYLGGIREAVSNPKILGLLVLTFLTYGVLSGADAFAINYQLIQVHLSNTTVGILGFSAVFIESMAMLSCGFLSGKIRSTRIITASLSLLFLGFFLQYMFYGKQVLVITGVLLIGGFLGLFIPTVIELLSRNTQADVENMVLSVYQLVVKFGAFFFGTASTTYFADVAIRSGSGKYNLLYGLYSMIVAVVLLLFLCVVRFFRKREK